MLDSQVDDMMDQLSSAEQELARKAAEADQDMMMASMVQPPAASTTARACLPFLTHMQILVVLQASDNAKEAEDNARKAKSGVKMVLNTISALLDQLGKNAAAEAASLAQ